MTYSNQEELLLYLYDELDEVRRKAVETKLKSSAGLREEFKNLQEDLNALALDEIPNKPADYGDQVWNAIAGELNRIDVQSVEPSAKMSTNSVTNVQASLSQAWQAWRQQYFALVLRGAAAAIVLVGVFYLGTLTNNNSNTNPTNSTSLDQLAEAWKQTSGEEIYRLQVAGYLEQSNRLFTELNQSTQDSLTLTGARRNWIDEMLINNRLFRLFANDRGDRQIAALLEQMEILLLELKNTDADASAEQQDRDLNKLRSRLKDQDLLYKLRFIQHQYQQSTDVVDSPRTQI